MTVFYNPILYSLVWFYHLLGDNLGLAIIIFTIAIRTVLIPFILPSLKAAKQMALLKPELDSLKKKHGHDPKLYQQKQLEFYKTHNINPASGCLPMIVQFIVLIALYRVFIDALGHGTLAGSTVATKFLLWDLKAKDKTYILPALAGILQFLTSVTLLPAVENEPEKRAGTKEQKEDISEMATSMQQQMVFMMPIMTVIFAIQFPSGLALYWAVTTGYSLVQQLVVAGPGGLLVYWNKYILRKGKHGKQ